MTPASSPLADRLRAYLLAFRTIGTQSSTGALLEDRLRSFLDLARPSFRAPELTSAIEASPVEITPERVSALMSKISVQIATSRPDEHLNDIWSVAGVKRNELRNAKVLAWLLNPRGSHGLRHELLERVLNEIQRSGATLEFDPSTLNQVRVRTEHLPLNDTRDRVDIALDGPNFVVFIEVKIDANEARDQIRRYVDAAQKKAAAFGKASWHVVYLSPRSLNHMISGVTEMSWTKLSALIRNSLSGLESASGSALVIGAYSKHVLTLD